MENILSHSESRPDGFLYDHKVQEFVELNCKSNNFCEGIRCIASEMCILILMELCHIA